MTENDFKVPKKQWNKWSLLEQNVFNGVYSYMLEDQNMFMHPKGIVNKDEHWSTTAWNAAWLAADEVKRQRSA